MSVGAGRREQGHLGNQIGATMIIATTERVLLCERMKS
jgi:hypothetical protein